MTDPHKQKILILDFGSQYTQLIARRVRELKVYCEIHPHLMPLDKIREFGPRGIILSGGPCSVYDEDAPPADERVLKLIDEWGVQVESAALRDAYFSTRVIPQKQHDAVVRLLAIFAQHLSMLSNQVVVQHENAEPPVITRAKDYINEHQTENLRLGHVAKACNTSTFYFCKMFKKVTGINFTDYLSRVRIEKSKNLLLNPNLRVSEIAFEVGFQSLTHFNRVFKKILGQSPSEYRAQLLGMP